MTKNKKIPTSKAKDVSEAKVEIPIEKVEKVETVPTKEPEVTTPTTTVEPKKPDPVPPKIEPAKTEDPKTAATPVKSKKSFFSFHKKEKAAGEPSAPKRKATTSGSFLTRINNIGMGKQAGQFIDGVATMLNAGLPLLDSLRIYEMEIKARAMKKNMKQLIESVENGASFWQAMEMQALFTPYDVAMIRIGEDAGNLARNMEYLSIQKEKDRALKAKVKMAMIYPIIVLTMMSIIVIGLGMFVLPNLIQVLFSLDVELPLTTRAVIWVTNMFTAHGALYIPMFIGLIILTIILSKFTRFKAVTQWVAFHIPGVGRLAREATLARFGVILGGLLRAGVPLVDALEALVDVTQTVMYKNFYAKVLANMRVGDSFAKSFEEFKETKKLLPVSVQQLIITGEQSGSLAESLIKIAEIHEKKAAETAEALPTILEPVLLLTIGALVGVIAFAIIVPIYSVVGSVGGR